MPGEREYLIAGKKYRRCEACGSAFLLPGFLLNEKDEKARYLLHQNGLDNDGYRTYLEAFLDNSFRLIGAESKAIRTVFDFGSGPAPSLVSLLRGRGYDARGWDPFFDSDGQEFPGGADLVTCLEVVEHFKDVRSGFERLSARVRKGAWCVIGTRVLINDLGVFEREFPSWWYRHDPTHVSFYTREGLEAVAVRNGLAPAGNLGSRLFLFRRESRQQ